MAKRYAPRPLPGAKACICGNTDIVIFPTSPKYRKWYCKPCGVICRPLRDLEAELREARRKDKALHKANLPESFKPWKLYGNGVRMSGYRTESKANSARDRKRVQDRQGNYWVEYEITAGDMGLVDCPPDTLID